MKYSATVYAKAFAEAVLAASPKDGDKLVRNLVALARRNGDAKELPKIAEEAGKIVRGRQGLRKFTFESARPLGASLRKDLRTIAGPKDVVEEKVDASLVAGVRVTVDDERQFDASLARKLRKMFVSSS